MVETLVSALTRATTEMESADLAQAAELSDDDTVRRRREEASEAGRQVLMRTRDAVATM